MRRVHFIGITYFAVVALIALPAPALAQQSPYQLPQPTAYEQRQDTARAAMRWEIAYQVLNAADAAITIYAVESGRGVEANPLFGKRPKPAVIIGAKAAWGVIHFLGVREITKKNPKLGLRIAQISVVGQGTVVGLNARFVF